MKPSYGEFDIHIKTLTARKRNKEMALSYSYLTKLYKTLSNVAIQDTFPKLKVESYKL